jgi:hypothetical protein
METIKDFFTLEVIYLIANYGVIPFWLMLVFIPSGKFTSAIINTIFLPTVLAATYGYLIYIEFYVGGILPGSVTDKALANFQLYVGLDSLASLFGNKTFLLTFWIHFLTLSLFVGTWIAKDALRQGIHKYVVMFPLVLTYFTGPLGLFLYLFLRMIIVQKITLHD